MLTYFIETKHVVKEQFHIAAESETAARRMAKSGDFEPSEVLKSPTIITCAWPLTK